MRNGYPTGEGGGGEIGDEEWQGAEGEVEMAESGPWGGVDENQHGMI